MGRKLECLQNMQWLTMVSSVIEQLPKRVRSRCSETRPLFRIAIGIGTAIKGRSDFLLDRILIEVVLQLTQSNIKGCVPGMS